MALSHPPKVARWTQALHHENLTFWIHVFFNFGVIGGHVLCPLCGGRWEQCFKDELFYPVVSYLMVGTAALLL